MWSGTFVGGESAANLDPQWSKAGVFGRELLRGIEATKYAHENIGVVKASEKQNKTVSVELRV